MSKTLKHSLEVRDTLTGAIVPEHKLYSVITSRIHIMVPLDLQDEACTVRDHLYSDDRETVVEAAKLLENAIGLRFYLVHIKWAKIFIISFIVSLVIMVILKR